MSANENQIVVCQPNETVRLDMRLENETGKCCQGIKKSAFMVGEIRNVI